MGLVTPVALGFAALSLPIIALYLLKIRRREEIVSSTLLWDRVARDLEANQPWQKFRPNWLLFLQLLALMALVVALARPFLSVEAALGAATVVVLDVSASMSAADGDATRLDAAKDEIRSLIAKMPAGGDMLIIAAGAQARVVQPMTDDHDALRAALDAIDPEKGQAAMTDAVALAAAAAARLPDAGIVVVSDGDVSAASFATISVPIEVISTGSGEPFNVGITTLAVGQGAGGTELFLRILNAAAVETSTRVTIYDDDTGAIIAAQDVTIPSRSDIALTFPAVAATTTVVRAELSGSARDDLAVDDVAWARTRSGERARVLLVTPGNLFLERALALLPELEVSLGAPDGGAPPGYDLYVFDGIAAPAGLQAPMLLLDPPAGNDVVAVTGDLAQPGITSVRTDDPILTNVDLSQTHLAAAKQLTTPAWATALVLSNADPLLLAGLRDGLRTAILGFDLHASDLPLQTAFPILVANLATWLLPETTPSAPLSVAPGAVTALYPRAGTDRIELTRPNGTIATIPSEPEVLFSGTGEPGSYRVRDLAGDTQLRAGGFVVNLLSATESDLVAAPVPEGAQSAPGSTTVAGGILAEGDGIARRLIWWPVVATGIAVLALEWWAFYRGRWRPRFRRSITPFRPRFGLGWLTHRRPGR